MTDGGHRCRVCPGGRPAEWLRVREMLLGTRKAFRYFRCGECGCLQIESVPADLGDYYPESYFSFLPRHRLARNRWRTLVDRRRVARAFGRPSALGWLADRVSKPLDYLAWARLAGADRPGAVLDVGCGTGKLLLRMRHGGFTRCVGVDPFVAAPIEYPGGVAVLRETVESLAARTDDRFDLVIFNHSLEHLPDQAGALGAGRRLMTDAGAILVRIPVCDGYAFDRYREHWVHLDAPRHLFLHTRCSVGILAEQLGLDVRHVSYDSTGSQFTGSELYRRDIPMNASEREKALFTRAERRRFDERARALNAEGRGDMALFVLRAA